MDGLTQVALSAGVTAIFHPIIYSKVLIQVGYEPVGPIQTSTIFGRKVLCYPNVFKYLDHIRREEGILALYRGLGARLTGGIVGSCVTSYVSTSLRVKKVGSAASLADEVDGEDALSQFTHMCSQTAMETLARCSGTLVSHPFHVVMVHSMTRFLVSDPQSSGLFTSVKEIYQQDGLTGFFAGLVPRLLGEVVAICLSNTLAHLLNTFIISRRNNDIKNYSGALCSVMVNQITYPFNLVANIMTVNNRLAETHITPRYSTWRSCWSSLKSQNQLKRGSSLFWRYYKGPVISGLDGSLVLAAAPHSS